MDSLTNSHNALDELRQLSQQGNLSSEEKQGLDAFIACVAPHLMEGATETFLGKIAMVAFDESDIDPSASADELLDKLSDQFDVEIEPTV
ncbi:hypothetical protein GCM10007147_32490 [Nocardiopsis kunsanensis]|uniref:Uncharacterized protein n=1 Tax=Nocardiopsis kunsanensis TaxID=141693 RepID=A0A919CJ70_9ACTN|nr:hypothetical protein [Nocardiopsis kunsanensis]GHD30567.1 hypothetical protein GCM10007147_32490 [Nocardiopsis kunsanensis]